MEHTLKEYLDISTEILSLGEPVIAAINGRDLGLRDRVVVGLGLKMYRAFQCLIEDAQRERAEAMHHLKTLIETLIYLNWARKDAGDTRARLIMAHVCAAKESFYRINQDERLCKEYHALSQDYVKGLEEEWKEFNKSNSVISLADQANLDEWYKRVYRLACEPAHIGDLQDHMPAKGGILKPQSEMGTLWAAVALSYAIPIMIWLLETSVDYFKVPVADKIKHLKKRVPITS